MAIPDNFLSIMATTGRSADDSSRRFRRPPDLPAPLLMSMMHLHNVKHVPLGSMVALQQHSVSQNQTVKALQDAVEDENRLAAQRAARDAFALPNYASNPFESTFLESIQRKPAPPVQSPTSPKWTRSLGTSGTFRRRSTVAAGVLSSSMKLNESSRSFKSEATPVEKKIRSARPKKAAKPPAIASIHTLTVGSEGRMPASPRQRFQYDKLPVPKPPKNNRLAAPASPISSPRNSPESTLRITDRPAMPHQSIDWGPVPNSKGNRMDRLEFPKTARGVAPIMDDPFAGLPQPTSSAMMTPRLQRLQQSASRSLPHSTVSESTKQRPGGRPVQVFGFEGLPEVVDDDWEDVWDGKLANR